MPDFILDVQGLETTFRTPDGVVHAVNGVSFGLNGRRNTGGGGGKWLWQECDHAVVLGLDPITSWKNRSGESIFSGQDLLKMSNEEIRHVRGAQIAMIFQDPMTSLNPVLTIGQQLEEPLMLHLGMTKKQARDACR